MRFTGLFSNAAVNIKSTKRLSVLEAEPSVCLQQEEVLRFIVCTQKANKV